MALGLGLRQPTNLTDRLKRIARVLRAEAREMNLEPKELTKDQVIELLDKMERKETKVAQYIKEDLNMDDEEISQLALTRRLNKIHRLANYRDKSQKIF